MLIRERLAHKRPVFSFEFFPPKTDAGEANLFRSLERLAPLEPDFVSVTDGAGGSTRARTMELVGRIKREFGIEAMAHLTCVGSTREDLIRIIDGLGDAGVENILALRGDPPKGETAFVPVPNGLRSASELVALVKDRGNFSVGGACYPEVHPEAPDAPTDLAYLRQKVDAGVDFLITQLFFDNDRLTHFLREARAVGIQVPVIAGIMPVTNVSQVERFTTMCGATIPAALHDRLREGDGDPQDVFWTGVSYSAKQCEQLLARGIFGVHFYTLNKSPATRAIFEILKLTRSGTG